MYRILIVTLFAVVVTPVAWSGEPRTDAEGNPLPPGAIARLGTLRFRTEGYAIQYDVAPDGRVVAAGDVGYPTFFRGLGWNMGPSLQSGKFRVWDVRTGKTIYSLPGRIESIRFSPDGRFVAVVIDPSDLRVIKVNGSKEVWRTTTTAQSTRAVTFAADSKTLVAPRIGDVLAFWDVETGKETRRIGGVPNPICVEFTPDDKQFMTGHAQVGGLRLWDTASGKEERKYMDFADNVWRVWFSADGKTFATGGGLKLNLALWDTATGQARWKAEPATENMPVKFSADGRELLTSGPDGLVWRDAATGNQPRCVLNRRVIGWCVPLADGDTLAWREGAAPRFYNLKTEKEAFQFSGHVRDVEFASFSPDAKTIVTVGGHLKFWDAATGRELPVEGRPLIASCAAFSPDGRQLAVAAADQSIRLWDVATRIEVKAFTGKTGLIEYLAFFPDGRSLLSHYRYDRVIFANGSSRETRSKYSQVWDVETGTEVRGVGSQMVDRAALSTDGRLMVGGMNSFQVWDAATGKRLAEFGERQHLMATTVTPDNRRMITALMDRSIRIWEIASASEILALPGRTTVATAVAISPSGRVLAVGDADSVVRLYDVDSGVELRRFEGHTGPVLTVNFPPDGRRLVSGGSDCTALVWDLTDVSRPALARPDAKEWPALWDALAAERGAKAQEPICKLAAAEPAAVVAFLSERMKAQPPASEAAIAKLIGSLDADKFADRERATAELVILGKQAEAALRQSLDKPISPEARRRIDALLTKLTKTLPSTLRWFRVVEILERIGTADAQRLLTDLSGPDGEAEVMQAAKQALGRLSKQRRP